MTGTEAANVALSGLTAGAIYGLLGVSYDVIFSTTGILNLAQGDLMMAGAMLGAAFGLNVIGLPTAVAFSLVVVAGCLMGIAEWQFAVKPAVAKGDGAFGWVLSTLGVSIILESAFGLIMSENVRSVPALASNVPHMLAGVLLIPDQLLLVGVSLLVAIVLAAFYRRTLIGKALSAIEQDRYGGEIRGLPVAKLAAIAFGIGGTVAAITGFLAGPITSAYPTMGITFALKGFIAAALGGIPNIWGALVAGWLLGVTEAFVGYAVGAAYQVPVVFAILLIALAVRPHGLFGIGTVREV